MWASKWKTRSAMQFQLATMQFKRCLQATTQASLRHECVLFWGSLAFEAQACHSSGLTAVDATASAGKSITRRISFEHCFWYTAFTFYCSSLVSFLPLMPPRFDVDLQILGFEARYFCLNRECLIRCVVLDPALEYRSGAPSLSACRFCSDALRLPQPSCHSPDFSNARRPYRLPR